MAHLMLVPSLSCPAQCVYCFGPHAGTPRMQIETVARAAAWIARAPAEEPVEITFHGGEPLSAGLPFYREALPLLRGARPGGKLRIDLQTNLWGMTSEMADLFAHYQVGLGTSLDGPEEINDRQRGKGYFRRTMAGLARAKEAGLKAGCIATLTSWSAGRWREILAFFEEQGLGVSFHAAQAGLGQEGEPGWALGAEEYGGRLVEMLDTLLEEAGPPVSKGMRIEPLDSILTGLRAGSGGICVFGDCLGKHMAVGPEGEVYPCQRFTGMSAFQMGQLGEDGGLEEVKSSRVWELFARREERVREECDGCEFLDFCRGGCPYNALVKGNGSFANGLRDPYCAAYRRILSEMVERAAAEVFSTENLAEVIDHPKAGPGLLRRGRLLERMRGPG